MTRNSSSADSRLRADNQETSATRKKPMMAGELGIKPMDIARKEMIMLLNAPKIKLEPGVNNMLAIMMGMVNRNRVRPFVTCWAVSLNANITLRKVNIENAATFPDQ